MELFAGVCVASLSMEGLAIENQTRRNEQYAARVTICQIGSDCTAVKFPVLCKVQLWQSFNVFTAMHKLYTVKIYY
jgi:hypothetical protein